MRTALSTLTGACVVFALLPGCDAAVPASRTASSVSGGKPAAPVDVTASLRTDGARVTMEFRAPATSVDVRVSGTSGLTITSPATVVENGSFAAGESASVVVTYAPPLGRANLVVIVTGVFNGVRGAKTASFTVGQPTPEQLQEAGAGVEVDASGEKIILLPAQRR